MAGIKLDRRVRNTKALLRGALVDILQDKPVGRIHVNEICAKAGVNRGTFYAHYTDVQDLQEQVFAEFLGKIGELMDSSSPTPGSPESIVKLTRILRFVYDNRRLALALLGENSSIGSQEAVLRFIREKQVFAHFPVPPEQEAFLYRFTAAGCLSVLREWMAHGTESPETISRLLMQTLCTGMSNFFVQ